MDVGCNGESTGSYVVEGFGGNSSNYNFTDGVTANTDGVFTMLAVGNYMVTISEQENPNCVSFCLLEITEPEVLTCTAVLVADVSCNGGSDGSASVTPLGGTAPYVYNWDNGETTATAVSLNATAHVVTVTDANGCVTTCDVLVNENPLLSCSVAVTEAILCTLSLIHI